ncbi:thiol:disulfide interchange protein DsbD [Allochromatium tepidum]|uniref:Thiol:disulfide interchange protein DsbD n=2 Tax=Allochromatium tepidum TaxID=553982 RepID=A0ABN6GDH3_9GAMM|nr:thiol:disulfide interchange protein DsbD [Allochromatium tepidum]
MKRPWLLAGAWLWLMGALGGTQALAEDFPTQEQAFPVGAEVIGPEAVRIVWDTADGYYLYKSKLRFDSETPGIKLGAAVLPEAETKRDEFFGEVEIYRGRLAAELPITREPGSGNRLTLRVGSQGCADAGFCYPPHRETLELELPPAAPVPVAAASAPTEAKPNRLAALLSSAATSRELTGTDEIPEVEQAFRFQSEVVAPDRVRLTWDIAPGTYLYADLVEIALVESPDVALDVVERPAGTLKPDSVLPDGSIGDVEIHQGRLDLTVPLQRATTAPTEATLIVKYQGCAEIGICYPPQTRRVALSLPEAPAAIVDALTKTSAPDSVQTPASAPKSTAGSSPPVSEQDRIAAVLAGEGLWVIIAVFFGFGLLLAFTPCIFPMIPILSGIIAGQGAGLTARKAFVLSLVYVLAMALTYTVVGVLAGLFGANLQAVFQDPRILTAFALVFVGLALSMFGFYELQLPSSLQSKLAELSNRQEGGTLIGVAIMGLLSALIVGPCVAPPLFGALIYISRTGDALLGGLALFALSLGMGAPLIVIGTSAGRYLPRAGAWMDAVKAVFGVALLGVAILMLERILPPAVAMLLWGGLLICSAVYMGALTQLQPGASGWSKLWKGLGLVLLIYGALMLVGAAAGGRDTLQPLRGLMPTGGSTGSAEHVAFKRIKSVADLERELVQAQSNGKPVLLDFYADWCVSCKEMERYTFSDPTVIAEMNRFVLLQADVTANNAEDRALIQGRFGLPGPPAILFFDRTGRELTNYRLVGFKPAEPFAAHLRQVAP